MTQSNQILEQAEQRAAGSQAQEQQAKEVEAARQEIGLGTYETAKRVLPLVERDIREIYRPFSARVVTIAQQANKPVPDNLRHWLQEMENIYGTCPNTIRQGIADYGQLSFAAIVHLDGRSVDVNKRANVVHSIRQALNIHDGQLSRLKSLKGQIEFFIKDSGWPG